ncbi:MAG TPA: aldehyde dehydrogenase family protein, partial [Bacteroidetes bacterium]|nr:aldehyde dehydrogenase family protein [Bacteroidota bacterium]
MAYQDILQTRNFIGGVWMSSENKMAVYDKYSQDLISEIYLADQTQIDVAIQSALAISKVFRKFSMERRIGIMEKLYEQLQIQAEAFAQLIASEGGKPISYARSEVSRALDNLKTGIREAYLFAGEQIPMDYLNGKNKTAYTIWQPLGIVLG